MPQLDDSGADTLDRYNWQASMAAADGLRLYLDALDDDGRPSPNIDSRVVCEYQEDWAAVDGDAVELVSAKHRDVTTGPFTTINSLADVGGVAHLFGRWHALNETPSCRMVTTFGLSPEVQKLEKAWEKLRELRLAHQPLTVPDEHHKPVNDLCQALRSYCKELPSGWTSAAKPMPSPTDAEITQVVRFLAVLDVEAGKPPRDHLAYAAANMYVRPLCDRLRLPIDPESIWAAVHDIFYARMRKAGPIPTGKLPAVLAYRVGSTSPDTAQLERSLLNRIVTLDDIDLAVRTAISQPHGYRPLPRLQRTTKLAVKMSAGQCPDNSIERAEHLAQEYRDFWREERSGNPTARAAQARLERYLLRISDEATQSTLAEVPRGPAFWQAVQRLLAASPPADLPSGMDSELLLGGICDLTSQCKVWFSDSFDVDEAIKAIQRGRGQTS
ncbi:hypothetical protein JK364_49140 [Streptomyces sp. 110]|uniref:Uncharacterized protein n=1 Tax=Streptomyces endocoffeicus TaxID=2898945 RepID=A0ABS1Q8F1_9ACTN|nr:hypothetical protein [Streptomyces endocoffeicus]MBL1120206.1 hypothetical protein [Streptomyces endocoffeicus]